MHAEIIIYRMAFAHVIYTALILSKLIGNVHSIWRLIEIIRCHRWSMVIHSHRKFEWTDLAYINGAVQRSLILLLLSLLILLKLAISFQKEFIIYILVLKLAHLSSLLKAFFFEFLNPF